VACSEMAMMGLLLDMRWKMVVITNWIGLKFKNFDEK
jgi:hypothetical protein